MPTLADLKRDPERLHQAATLLETENKKLIEKNLELQSRVDALEGRDPGTLQMRIAELEQQLSVRNQALFGDKSEKRNRAARRAEQKKAQTGHGPRDQAELPRIEQVHTLDDADEMCPKCGGELQIFAGQFEEANEVDVVERRFVLVKHKRQKYRCDCGCIETAEGPPKLQKSGRYSVGFATAVAVGKYADHLPLQRQVVQMRRQGLQIDSQTLWDQLFALSTHVQPAYETLHAHVLSHPVVGADETTWRLMGKKAVTNTKRWQVWALSAPDAVVYQLHPSRGADAAAQLLQDFEGTVMCDGYSAYQALEKRRHDFKLAHCWAHARRKFVEIEESFPKQSEEALELIAELYRIEREIDEEPPDERLRIRQQRAGPVVQQIHRWALQQRALPQSPLGKAIAYLGKHFDGLRVFLTDSDVPLDNNRTERAMRGVVVGRKNHYGSRSERGTQVAAMMYSLVETAKINGVDPELYLKLAALEAIGDRPIPLPHQLG
ncbi:MAG: IS66 family transposase [Myxococcales bacterium]|nr:IS66 family transposase [Myxococcales bacterium]